MFLNVDLDLASRRDLTPLVEELARSVVVVHERRARGVHHVSLELAALRYRTPGACLARFATLLERLSPAGRKLWASAKARRFDIGIETPASGPAYTDAIAPETAARVARLGATIALTVYPSRTPREA